MLNSNKLFIFRSSEIKQKGGVRELRLTQNTGCATPLHWS